MKNILDDKPLEELFGRFEFSAHLVKETDIKNKHILDIGCGFGWFVNSALKRGAKEVAGLEISPEDLKTAKRNIHNKKAVFKVSGALKLPFGKSYFDTVVAWEVLEHIPQNTEHIMFQEVHRVLKRGGTFYLSTPYRSLVATVFDPAFWLTGHRHYSNSQIEIFGVDNQFRVNKVLLKGGFWSIVGMWDMYISKWIFRRERFFDSKLKVLEKKELKSNKGGFMQIYAIYTKI
jgi:ubiquinone/menaquinone biosynthesis C-methylase UbiE